MNTRRVTSLLVTPQPFTLGLQRTQLRTMTKFEPHKNDPKLQEWHNKLVGKTYAADAQAETSNDNIVTAQDLPPFHRVLGPRSIMTMDFRPDRLNVHVNDANKIMNVRWG
ncbi:hypothetical protein BZG36_01017 [Bifiguratus adelaidae]|uniref:Uncharacterized protein n=1 Tax=Bifiguratus adelaidae TaxID=1938954 RepID=A0A261Y6A4_9FUNG|nr:hypothetical protein BZG36_01017 [Bifiguratus adelaidae]